MATFGKTTNGASTQSYTSDRKLVSLATPTTSGTVTAGVCRMYTATAVSVPVRMVIYSSTAGEPDALLAVSDDTSFNSNTEADRAFTFSGANQIQITGGVGYWIGPHYDYTTQAVLVSRDNTAGLVRSNNDTFSDGSANPFGVTATTAGAIDAYITYTETSVKTIDGLIKASVKTVDGLAVASVKTINGLA